MEDQGKSNKVRDLRKSDSLVFFLRSKSLYFLPCCRGQNLPHERTVATALRPRKNILNGPVTSYNRHKIILAGTRQHVTSRLAAPLADTGKVVPILGGGFVVDVSRLRKVKPAAGRFQRSKSLSLMQ